MKLTESNYYSVEANKEYASNSQIKDFQKCEVTALKKISGEIADEPTTAMLQGQYVDEALTGNLEKWKSEHPEIIAKTGVNKGCIKADFQKCEKMVDVCVNDNKFMQYLSGKKQVIMTGEIYGLPIKIKMDVYDENHGVIVDLKTTEDINKAIWNVQAHCYQDFITAYGYIQQMAIYREIVFQKTGKKCRCFIAVVDKKEYPNHDVIEIPQEEMDDVLYGNELNPGLAPMLQRIKDLKDGIEQPIPCGKCPECISTKKVIKPISLAELRGRLD